LPPQSPTEIAEHIVRLFKRAPLALARAKDMAPARYLAGYMTACCQAGAIDRCVASEVNSWPRVPFHSCLENRR